jgi:hypothetical protein
LRKPRAEAWSAKKPLDLIQGRVAGFPGRSRATERLGADDALKRDEIGTNRYRALALCSRMIFSENRFTLFRIML